MPPIISNNLIKTYQSAIDNLIQSLGKPMLFMFKSTVQGNSTFYDTIRGDDNLKPDYKQTSTNQAPVTVLNAKLVQALVQWNPKDAQHYGIRIDDPTNLIRLKCFLTDAADIARCEYMVPNVALTPIVNVNYRTPLNQPQQNIDPNNPNVWFDQDGNPNCSIDVPINTRFKLLRYPEPIGLQQDRYCISFWQQVS